MIKVHIKIYLWLILLLFTLYYQTINTSLKLIAKQHDNRSRLLELLSHNVYLNDIAFKMTIYYK